MRIIYSILLNLLTPFIVLRLWLKSRKLSAYNQRIKERFGFFEAPREPIDVWLHAVSLGETIAAIPIIEQLLNKNLTVAVTNMTPTGSQRVQQQFGARVFNVYLPYDAGHCVKRFLKSLKPKVGVIMETELWPNLIHYAHKRALPLLLINARLSPKSYQGYKRIRWLLKPLLNKLSLIATQTEQDSQRFQALGVAAEKVRVMGNVKFDVAAGNVDEELIKQLKSLWGRERKVLIAASTHAGEESILIDAYRSLKQQYPALLLLIAPRHPERFNEVIELVQSFRWAKRSDISGLNERSEIFVIDSLGELLNFYAAADVAFVGGSLVAIGGHNVLEPMAMETAVITGKHVFNFKHIIDQARVANALISVEDNSALISALKQLLDDNEARKELIANAKELLAQNTGVVNQYVDLICLR